jgi:hypothetical protein|tara:strand:+ start:225 stop:761 length:537 start_codon:yes stop_codon:yes gene_type:complete
MATLHEKLSAIQHDFKSKKSRYNSFGKYNYRSAEDILEALKPINLEWNVYFTISEQTVGFSDAVPMIKSTATIFDAETGESISASALVGVDLLQKGMQVPQAFGSASSYGKKYALGNLLLIDDTADADATNNHSKTKPELKGEDLNKAKSYIKNGGSVAAIKSKYSISKEMEQELATL